MFRWPCLSTLVAAFVVACGGDDGVHHQPDAPVPDDACVPAAVSVDVVAPSAYACHEPFKSKVTVTNGGCTALTVQSVKLSAVVTSGACGPPGPGTYPGMTIAAGASTVVLDLTSGPFCCGSPGCPTPFECDEHYTVEVVTPTGTLTSTNDVHLALGGCDVICP